MTVRLLSDQEDATAYRPDFLASGGRMARLVQAMDWSKTSLGPIEQCPQWRAGPPSDPKAMRGRMLPGAHLAGYQPAGVEWLWVFRSVPAVLNKDLTKQMVEKLLGQYFDRELPS